MKPHSDGGSMVSYWAGAWCSQDTFVTAGTTGGSHAAQVSVVMLCSSQKTLGALFMDTSGRLLLCLVRMVQMAAVHDQLGPIADRSGSG